MSAYKALLVLFRLFFEISNCVRFFFLGAHNLILEWEKISNYLSTMGYLSHMIVALPECSPNTQERG